MWKELLFSLHERFSPLFSKKESGQIFFNNNLLPEYNFDSSILQ